MPITSNAYCDSSKLTRSDSPGSRGWDIVAKFCRLKDFRRIATRYDKLARNFLSALSLAAAIAFWL